ncbi:MAG: sulfotransferase [Acidimicrobiales bacterium]
MLRRTNLWRRSSSALKGRLPGVWQRLMTDWGKGTDVLEPLTVARDLPLGLASGWRDRSHLADVRSYVMFVGYPRSGHSIIGSLLNAHPNVMAGHRVRVLRYAAAGYPRTAILGMSMVADQRFARMGRVGSKRYDYTVPGQWQGRFTTLMVVGDTNVTNRFLQRRPETLAKLRQILGLPVKLVHIVRNPYDNIATMSVRNRLTLAEAADSYFSLCDGSVAIRALVEASDWFDLRHEDVIGDCAAALSKLCGFLGVPAPDDYLADCTNVIYSSPNRSRNQVEWPPEVAESVASRMAQYEFLAGYRFDD